MLASALPVTLILAVIVLALADFGSDRAKARANARPRCSGRRPRR